MYQTCNCYKNFPAFCQKCHYVSIHRHRIGLLNFCHIWNICYIQDITFNVSSILQMHDSKFLLYLKATAYQYLLSNKKSSKYIHTRLECWLSTIMHGTFWNYNFQLPECISTFMHYEYTAQSKHIFQRNYIH